MCWHVFLDCSKKSLIPHYYFSLSSNPPNPISIRAQPELNHNRQKIRELGSSLGWQVVTQVGLIPCPNFFSAGWAWNRLSTQPNPPELHLLYLETTLNEVLLCTNDTLKYVILITHQISRGSIYTHAMHIYPYVEGIDPFIMHASCTYSKVYEVSMIIEKMWRRSII